MINNMDPLYEARFDEWFKARYRSIELTREQRAALRAVARIRVGKSFLVRALRDYDGFVNGRWIG